MKQLEVIVCQGRSFGIHVMVCAQFLDSKTLPAVIRNNLISKVAFRANSDAASISTIGNSRAFDLSPIAGRFILALSGSDMIKLQMPFLSDEKQGEILRTIPFTKINADYIQFLQDNKEDELLQIALEENRRRGFTS